MILKRLVEFSERLADLPPPGYQSPVLQKLIRLNLDGSFRQVITLSGEGTKQKPGKKYMVPREQPQRAGTAPNPRLIADNANYALGKVREKDKPGDAEKRHASYVELVQQCAEATQEPTVQAVLTFLRSDQVHALATGAEIEENDDLDFQVDGIRPCDLPSVRAFWASRMKSDMQGRCLVTGQVGPIVDRMPISIKGIPDGQMSGTALVSVNNASCESFGLKAAYNSPISAYAAEALCNGLNYLLAEKQHHLRVGKAVYLVWTTNPDEVNFLDLLRAPDPKHVTQLLKSVGIRDTGLSTTDSEGKAFPPRYGKSTRAASIEEKDFFVLALSANASRIVVRDSLETTLGNAKRAMAEWFEKIEIIPPDGSDEPKRYGLYILAGSLYRDANKDMPAHVPTSILRSAFTGAPLPTSLLGIAVKRNLAMQGPYNEYNGQRYLSGERMALIKAILEQQENINLSALNPQHPDAAYHCGRLLAVLEKIQRSALGEINATVVDRFYGAACTSPGTVLGNLVNDSQSHLAKMRKDKGDGWAQNELGEVLSAVGDHFPKTLNLTQQGLFALGFYHQKAHDRAAATAAKAKKESGETE